MTAVIAISSVMANCALATMTQPSNNIQEFLIQDELKKQNSVEQDGHYQAARELSNFPKQFDLDALIKHMLELHLESEPMLRPYSQTLHAYFKEIFVSDEMTDKMANVYMELFSTKLFAESRLYIVASCLKPSKTLQIQLYLYFLDSPNCLLNHRV